MMKIRPIGRNGKLQCWRYHRDAAEFGKRDIDCYKNNRPLGVMKDGLSGPYCWHTVVAGNETVAIKKGSPPTLNNDTRIGN